MSLHGRAIQLPGWLLLNIAALGSALAHTFIDQHLGLYGESSSSMSLLQAINIFMTCLVVAWWTLSLSVTTGTARPGLSAALVLSVGWTFVGNGLAIVFAPPPADAFPYQDLAHLISLVFGALAAIATRREMTRNQTAWSRPWVGMTLLLLITIFTTQAVASAPYV